MPSKNDSGVMQYTWDFVHRVLIALMVLGFGMAILGAVGEVLGWWNDIGEVLMTVGTILGALTGVMALLGGASEATIQSLRNDVGDVHDAVIGNGEKLGTLDAIEVELDTQTSVLEDIRDSL